MLKKLMVLGILTIMAGCAVVTPSNAKVVVLPSGCANFTEGYTESLRHVRASLEKNDFTKIEVFENIVLGDGIKLPKSIKKIVAIFKVYKDTNYTAISIQKEQSFQGVVACAQASTLSWEGNLIETIRKSRGA